MNQISLAISIQEISDCSPVMSELRPHLSQASFITQVRRQQEQYHYQLVYLQTDNNIVCVAGFRVSESLLKRCSTWGNPKTALFALAWGKFLYVDDLVTLRDRCSEGFDGLLFDWLVEYARVNSCQQLTLDSGVQRFAAHRFYLHHRMEITSHHFTLKF